MRRAVITAALLIGAQPLAAQDWSVDCQADACTISQSLSQEGSGRLVATILALVGRETDLSLGVALALGAALEPGVVVLAGEDTLTLPFQVCFPDGCRALRPVSADEREVLTQAGPGEIRFFPYGNDTPVSIGFSLDGFGEAIAEAEAELGG